MKRFTSALLIALLCAVFAVGQTSPSPPQPGPELKKLDYFTGTWRLSGNMHAGPFGPAGKFTGTENNQWMPGGFFLLSHSEQTMPAGKIKGFSVFGYDTDAKTYTYHRPTTAGEKRRAPAARWKATSGPGPTR